jgi:hypothetical protein
MGGLIETKCSRHARSFEAGDVENVAIEPSIDAMAANIPSFARM